MKTKLPAKDLTLIQLFDRFGTDEKARVHLEKVLWPNGIVCPKCQCNDQTKFSDIAANAAVKTRAGLRWCANCKDKFTVTIGTVFEDSKIPLRKWLIAWYLICSSKKGISSLQLQRLLELGSYRTALFMAHRVRHALRDTSFAEKLDGIVEADECFIPTGGTGGTVKRPRKLTGVFTMVQRGGAARSKVMPTVNGANLKQAIRDNVAICSEVHTDGHLRFVGLDGYLRASDVEVLTNQGLQIVSIFERTPTNVSYFTIANADTDAADAIAAAILTGQPSGSAIYFTVDFEPGSNPTSLSAIDSYFQEIRTDFNQYFSAHPGVTFKIGVYAAGDVLPTIMNDASVGASYSWLAEPFGSPYPSPNLAQTQDSTSSNPILIGGIKVDLDEAYTANFGQWGSSSTSMSQPVFGGSSVSSGQLQTTLSGLSVGKMVIIYASTDLMNWTPVKTNIVNDSTLTFTNTIDPAIKCQYFRCMEQ